MLGQRHKKHLATILTVRDTDGDKIVLMTDISGVKVVETDATNDMNQLIQTHYKNKSLTSEVVIVLNKIKDLVTSILELIKGTLRE